MKACNQCGKCCIQYSNGGLVATSSEIEHWTTHYPEIAEYTHAGNIWVDPKTKQSLVRCPWLKEIPQSSFSKMTVSDHLESSITGSGLTGSKKRYSCSIYLQRPDDCRHYPVTIDEMIRDECEMIEISDLKRPRLAQRKLDKLMADSRPATR
jgi:Fe-S-cluster containining protein